ncbi:hypothetical protein [Aeromonas salmonicida]|uniref:hypothetical protein n=1 Tax=Aeromonas salmonicida TaxID=645 RepID=UPI00232E631A|nr:hypothetical protein [Aeromonas salmonicida]WCH24870.1 hypothetical protein ONZ54_11280 [Aeromonas salmonicida]
MGLPCNRDASISRTFPIPLHWQAASNGYPLHDKEPYWWLGLYSPINKTPLVVVERLNAALLREAKSIKRSDQFYPALRIPASGRAELDDYRGQQPAVDRGCHFQKATAQPPPMLNLK